MSLGSRQARSKALFATSLSLLPSTHTAATTQQRAHTHIPTQTHTHRHTHTHLVRCTFGHTNTLSPSETKASPRRSPSTTSNTHPTWNLPKHSPRSNGMPLLLHPCTPLQHSLRRRPLPRPEPPTRTIPVAVPAGVAPAADGTRTDRPRMSTPLRVIALAVALPAWQIS